jgi:lipopolysaccharide transport system permease protein
MTFGMFFSPVIYPPPTAWPQSIVNYLNPVSPFVIAARDLAIGGGLSQPFAYTVTSVVSVIVFAAGWRSFRIVMPRVLERL